MIPYVIYGQDQPRNLLAPVQNENVGSLIQTVGKMPIRVMKQETLFSFILLPSAYLFFFFYIFNDTLPQA